MYHVKATMVTTRRILQQLSHDHRTVALIFLVPCLLLSLLRWMFEDNIPVFNHLAPSLLGVFPFTIMFIITSITTLRERTGGTMERLMALPIAKIDLMMGYMLAFGLLAVIQASIASAALLYWLGLDIAGPEWFLVIMAVADAVLGTALGLFLSAFARTEFQAVQFMPAFVLPQLLICGLLVPLEHMPELLATIAYCMPMTYAVDALQILVTNSTITDDAWRDLWIVVAYIIGALLLGALTLRRRTK